jgi:hypothetical protein
MNNIIFADIIDFVTVLEITNSAAYVSAIFLRLHYNNVHICGLCNKVKVFLCAIITYDYMTLFGHNSDILNCCLS